MDERPGDCGCLFALLPDWVVLVQSHPFSFGQQPRLHFAFTTAMMRITWSLRASLHSAPIPVPIMPLIAFPCGSILTIRALSKPLCAVLGDSPVVVPHPASRIGSAKMIGAFIFSTSDLLLILQ